MSYSEIFLTPAQQDKIDPTGRGREFLKGFVDSHATPECILARRHSRSEWKRRFDEFLSKQRSQKHTPILEYEDEMACKYGPQGASFSMEKVKEIYREHFDLAGRPFNTHPKLVQGRDALLDEIRDKVEQFGYPQIGYELGVCGTAAALPTMMKKGEFLAETLGAKGWRHTNHTPILPGQRNMRGKDRVVNQDACSNVRYIEGICRAVKKWLVKYMPQYFAGWIRPDKVLMPMITQHFQRGHHFSVEADYKACDQHFSWELAQAYVLPVYEALLDQMTFVKFAAAVEELFMQPVFCGNSMLVGKHTLLSGQVITNDFETIFDVILAIATMLRTIWGWFAANGDDVTLLVAAKAEEVYELYCYLADSAGMEISDEKKRISVTDVRFCRKVYYPAAPKSLSGDILGAYPSILSLNNVVNPERYMREEAEVWKATLQRMDVVYGSPYFTPYVQFVASQLVKRQVDEEAIDAATSYDWWERVYGEPWTLRKSEAYRVMRKSGLW